MAKSPKDERRKAERARVVAQGLVAEIHLRVVRLTPRRPSGGAGRAESALVRLEGDGLELAEVRYPRDDSARSAEEVVASLKPWLERALRKGLEKALQQAK